MPVADAGVQPPAGPAGPLTPPTVAPGLPADQQVTLETAWRRYTHRIATANPELLRQAGKLNDATLNLMRSN